VFGQILYKIHIYDLWRYKETNWDALWGQGLVTSWYLLIWPWNCVLHYNCHKMQQTVPWRRRLTAGLSSRGHCFGPRSVHVRFVVNKVALEQRFVAVLRLSPATVIPLMLHSLSFNSINVATGSVVKQGTHTHTHTQHPATGSAREQHKTDPYPHTLFECSVLILFPHLCLDFPKPCVTPLYALHYLPMWLFGYDLWGICWVFSWMC